MATKDCHLVLKNKQQTFDNSFSCDNNQYSNLNLNQNQECKFSKAVQSKSTLLNDKEKNTEKGFADYNGGALSEKSSSSGLWKKNDFTKPASSLNFHHEKQKGILNSNNSTLSLHITAYENSFDAQKVEKNSDNSETKEKKFVKNWKNVPSAFSNPNANSQNPFEFPRQQNEGPMESEVMQFKASQKLLNPNENSAKNFNQSMTPKKPPPIVYHSNQIKGLNGVDDIQEKYLYNAVVKLDEQTEHFILPAIERLTKALEEIKKTEHGEKDAANLIADLLAKVLDGSILENMKMKKKFNISRKLEVYNSFADSTKLSQAYNNTFLSARKFLVENLLNTDLILLLSTKIAYCILHSSKDIVNVNLPKLSNFPSSSSVAMSLNNEEILLSVNSILDYCLELWSTRGSFNKMFINTFESERLKLCDTNMKVVVHQRKKHLKAAKEILNEVKTTSREESVELYTLASKVKKDDKHKALRISTVEITKMQDGIKDGRELCEQKKVSIETRLQSNKEAIIKNAELEFFEKETRRSASVLQSRIYLSQLAIMPKLEREKRYWSDTLSHQLQNLKCTVYQAYMKNSEFRRNMISLFQQFPQNLPQSRSAIENAVALQNDLIGQIARRRYARYQSTQKCRSQWSQHYDVIEVALNDASAVEEAGFGLKDAMLSTIQKEMEEYTNFSKISLTVPFTLPARLIPPFPQNEARLLPDIPIRIIDKKLVEISPCRPASAKLAISVSPPIPSNEVKESPSVAASERSKDLIVAEPETIEGCTSSGIRYTIRAERSSGKTSRMSSADERHQRKRKRSESPEYYHRDEKRERRDSPYYHRNDSRDRRGSIDSYRDEKRRGSPEYSYRDDKYDRRRSPPERERRRSPERERRRSPEHERRRSPPERERRRSPEHERRRSPPERERRGRISEMYERDYGRYEKDSDRRDSGRHDRDYGGSTRSDDKYGRDYDRDYNSSRNGDRYEKDYDRRDRNYDRYDKDYDRKGDRNYDRRDSGRYDRDYDRSSRNDDRRGKDYDQDYGRSSRNDDGRGKDYDRDYGRSSRNDDRYERNYDRYDRDSSRSSSTVSMQQRRRDSDDTPRRSRNVTPEREPSPEPVNISSELELEPISDDENGLTRCSSAASNVSRSILLANINDYVYPKAGEITVDKMPRRLADLFKHVIIPEQIQRPIAFPAEHENLKKLIQWLDSKRLKLSTEKKKLLERLILKNFIQYCQSEQEHILKCDAAEDYLDYRVFPVEIVKEIYQNVKEGEAAFNELRQLRNAEQKMTKAKTASAVGFAKLLFGCTKELESLFDVEQQELSCVANRAKKENSNKFSNEYLNHLRELKTHLQDYCSSVGIMESKQTVIKEFLNEWKEMLNEQIKIIEKRKQCHDEAKQKLAARVEEKRKKLAELKEQSQKLAESRVISTIKAHENTISLSKVKIRYNQLLDRIGKADSAADQIDVISEHLFKHYKELLSCPTCKVNPKNCALTKCYHLFCEECITKLFKTRNRKCPECNTRVGPNDYHRVYF